VDIKAVKDSTELTMIPFMESIDGKDIKPLRNGPVSVRRMLKKQIQDSMAPSRVHVWCHPGSGSERSCARIQVLASSNYVDYSVFPYMFWFTY